MPVFPLVNWTIGFFLPCKWPQQTTMFLTYVCLWLVWHGLPLWRSLLIYLSVPMNAWAYYMGIFFLTCFYSGAHNFISMATMSVFLTEFLVSWEFKNALGPL